MKVELINDKLFFTDKNGKRAVEMCFPIYIENRTEKTVKDLNIVENRYVFTDEHNNVEITVEKKSETLFYVKRKWTNISLSERKIQTVFRIRPCFEVEKYLIPCVSINGNEFGAGLEPKGLTKDGKKWVFAYDRVAVPSCTLTENSELAVGLFASAESEESLVSSCSISKDENQGFIQELFHPVIEAPITYSSRDLYSEGYEEFITLASGECFECGVYISISVPRWKNFGICDILDSAIEVFGDNAHVKTPAVIDVWNNSLAFAKSLIDDYKGKRGFCIGYSLSQEGSFVKNQDKNFELAWCGQNILFCRMFIEDYVLQGNKEMLDIALEILDTRVECCTAKCGLLSSQLRFFEALEENSSDTCNMGYGAYELIRVYERLKQIGIEKNSYLEAARGCCDFFIDNFSEEYGFGKQWRLDGACIDKGGTIGAFLIPAFAKLYDVTKDRKYLDMAEKAMKYYVERDLDKFCCTAGALDTCCVDKETSAPFIMSAILLYELTKKEIYLEYGKKAAYYFTSWMMHYQPVYPADSEIVKHNVCITGMTSVSTQHHHLDMYAGIVVPYLRKLAEYTKDPLWRVRADMMWRAVLQYVSDGSLVVHGITRPEGSQNEALFHCRWTFGHSERGCLNDWLVAWPCAFRLSVLAEELRK